MTSTATSSILQRPPTTNSGKSSNLISKANKPVLAAGGGIISAAAHEELKEFAELISSLRRPHPHGIGGISIPTTRNLPAIGTECMERWAGNWAVCESDFLLYQNVERIRRPDYRQSRQVRPGGPRLFISASTNPSTIKRSRPFSSSAPAPSTPFGRMCELIKENGFEKPDLSPRLETIDGWKKNILSSTPRANTHAGQEAIEALYEESKGGNHHNVPSPGQHRDVGRQVLQIQGTTHLYFLTWAGDDGLWLCGGRRSRCTFVRTRKSSISTRTAPSFMSVQELATAKIEKTNAKCLLLEQPAPWDGHASGKIRFTKACGGHTILCDPNLGGPDNLDAIYPDYVKMCEDFGVKNPGV